MILLAEDEDSQQVSVVIAAGLHLVLNLDAVDHLYGMETVGLLEMTDLSIQEGVDVNMLLD